ncbi:protein transport protein S31 [Arthrobotrys musiformis]|uniref:Protein transport protein SEC31 n=1 Tax=Arthrobotrys musiformis TaxID=47236 RepID=A0AAV9WA74_9PEZI
MVNLRIPRTATFAWSEDSSRPLLATGTVAGAVDADFSNTTHLELWDLDLDSGVSEDSELTPKATISTDARFHGIAWGKTGIIAGGLENGSLNLWKAESLLKGESDAVEALSKHTGAIKALQFNPSKDELLLTAGVQGEIYVWDINNPANPFLLGTRARTDEFSSVDWNKKISHILLSGGKNGLVTVWDVKQKKESLTLSHLGRKEVSAVAWHPENATKLLTALPDDSNPVVMLWDLRNANAPEKILTGHDQGVLSLDWCKHDPNILLSSGKDNRTICWNPNSGEMLGEFPMGTNWMFQTRFSPKNPNLVASASFDGKISIQSLQSKGGVTKGETTSTLDGEDFFARASFDPQGPSFSLKQAPRWYKRPVGASFGFGGKLVSFTTPDGQQKSTVKITTLAVESDVRATTDAFESELKGGNFETLCDKRISELTSEPEKAEWTILKALFDPSPKKKLIEFLGFTRDAPKAQEESVEKTEDVQVNGDSKERRLSAIFGSSGEDDAFLSELSSPKGVQTNNPFNLFTGNDSEADKTITNALILGDFDRAVDVCIREDRLSDAFMLAVAGGEAALKKVQKAYFSKQTDAPNYLRLLSSVVEKDLADVVHNADLAGWKEVLCAICTYADEKGFPQLCEALGERLEVELKAASEPQKRQDAATCYLSSSRLDKVIGIWIEEYKESEATILKNPSEGSTSFGIHVQSMQKLIEKVTVFREATKFVDPQMDATADWALAPLYDIYCEYADVLAAQGQLDFAARYLSLVPLKYQPAEIARNRVKIASGQVETKKPAAAVRTVPTGTALRTATKSPYAPVSAPRTQPAPTMFTPVQPPAPSVVPRLQPTTGYNPPQVQPTSRYTPAGSSATAPAYAPTTPAYASTTPAYTPSIPAYQPSAGVGSRAPFSNSNSPFSGTAEKHTPASLRNDLPDWNDAPMVIDTGRRKTPSVPPSAPITTPFPMTQPNPLGSPTHLPPPPRGGTPVIPTGPPRAGQPIGISSGPPPMGAPYRSQTPGSQPHSPYVPQSPPQGQPRTGPTPPRAHAAYAPPPAAAGPPSNRYTPSAPTHNAPSTMPPTGPSRGMIPPPAGNPYAPPPSSQPLYGQPTPHQPMYNEHAQPQGPPMAGPPMAGPPMAGPPMAGPPPMGPPRGAAGPQQSGGPPPPPPPKAATPKPKHPKGDRSHIPEHGRLLYEILSEEMERVTANAPADFKAQVQQLGKRLDIFFDHLNNDDLLSHDATSRLTDVFVHVKNGNYDEASNAYANVQSDLGSFGVVHKKLIQLSQFARSV